MPPAPTEPKPNVAAVGLENPEQWAFTDGDGQPVHPHAVYEAFRRIVHNAGVPTVRFHDLRHTHGSLLIQDGIHVKGVSERLGHANIAFTRIAGRYRRNWDARSRSSETVTPALSVSPTRR